MKKRLSLLFLGFSLFSFLSAQESLLQNTYLRNTTSLDGEWKYIVDPYENGYYNYRYQPFLDGSRGAYFGDAKPRDKSDLLEYDFDASPSISVPGDWNTQKENLFYYEGTVWYRKTFAFNKKQPDNRVFLRLEAANYQTDVYLNGDKLGRHVGGFTPFNFEVTNKLRPGENSLVVKVDNKRVKEGVPTLNTDWWNYGGITRSVKLIEVPTLFVRDYFVQLDPENPKMVKGYVQIDGPDVANVKVQLSISDIKIDETLTTDDKGYAAFNLKAKKVRFWTPNDPFRYPVEIKVGEDKVADLIGFRTITTQGQDILLNGESIFLKGICLHEESPTGPGRGHSLKDARQLLNWAKELGCNYVRLAHYPHNENMVRLADEMGILVWEENPVYWTIEWENPATYANAENQLREVISRDKNRASVIIWSMANETPTSEARNEFLGKLAATTRKLDPTRLISAALEQSDYQGNKKVRTISDEFADQVDVLSFNQYIGWYDGLPDKCKEISWVIEQNKPVLISEFGAGAKYGMHGDSLTRWTEEYQAYLYRETIKMITKLPQLRGFSPWILVDFRSPRRPLPKIQDGWNRKGLISEKGEKKQAFEVLRKYYEK